MEFVRSFSAKDATGLFAHTAAFIAGFAYVLCFLPPMGDGSMLPAHQPYVVPCAYNSAEFATSETGNCIRLFSELYEYPVETVQRNTKRLFIMVILYTLVNTRILQRAYTGSEGIELLGFEVSAICCNRRRNGAQANAARRAQATVARGTSVALSVELLKLTNAPYRFEKQEGRSYQLK
eukprot:1050832-Amphidinium_carterae.1